MHIFCGTRNTIYVSVFVRQCSTASVSDFETSDMANVGKIRQNDVTIWNSIDSPFIFSYHGWLTCATFISLVIYKDGKAISLKDLLKLISK